MCLSSRLLAATALPLLFASSLAFADSNVKLDLGSGNKIEIHCQGSCTPAQLAALANNISFAPGSSDNRVQIRTQADAGTQGPIQVSGTKNQVQINQQKGTNNSTAPIEVGGSNNRVQIQQKGSNNSTQPIVDTGNNSRVQVQQQGNGNSASAVDSGGTRNQIQGAAEGQ